MILCGRHGSLTKAVRLAGLLLLATLGCSPAIAALEEPFQFVAMGDSGSDSVEQRGVADRMEAWSNDHPFSDVLMLGDNIYGNKKLFLGKAGGDQGLFADRFDAYYQPFQERGIQFHAVLGNHDTETRDGQDEIQDTRRFGITGPRGYYKFSSPARFNVGDKPLIDFFALNSTLHSEDPRQLQWLEDELQKSVAVWKVVFLHHPLYTPRGKHKPCRRLREKIEPLFKKYGVQIVLAGHNHFYARMKPIEGVVHFVSGGGGRDLKTPKPESQDCTESAREQSHFLYFEVYPDRVTFQAVPIGTGAPPFDSGTIDPNFLNGTQVCKPW